MKSVLIVEDDKQILLAMSVRLKAHGYQVYGAPDGLTGVALAARMKPDLIIMDIRLPAGNGFVTAGRISNLVGVGGTPILFYTASSHPSDRDQANNLNAAGYFVKPEQTDALIAKATEILAA